MFIEIAALLSIFQLICAGVSTNLLFSNSENLTENISDDMTFKNIQYQLELLQTMNENLSVEMTSLGLTFNYYLTKQRNEIKDDLEELKAALIGTQKLLRAVDSDDPENFFLNDDETTEKEQSEETGAEPPEDVTPLSESATEKSEEETAQGNTEEPSEETTQSVIEEPSEETAQSATKEPSEETSQSVIEEPSEETTQSVIEEPTESVQPKLNQSNCVPLPKNCAEALKKTGRNGIYRIEVADSELTPFFVYCLKNNSIELSKENEGNNGFGSTANPWMVIQRRQDGSIDFLLNWADYQLGFGNLEGEFFMGLDKLHAITASRLHELWIQMEDFEGGKRFAKYSSFAIGGESQRYALNVLGNYSGDADDSLIEHQGLKWNTKDKAKERPPKKKCNYAFTGAWWFTHCHESNLNGLYLKGEVPKPDIGKGITWKSWRGLLYSMKYVHMAIRPIPNQC